MKYNTYSLFRDRPLSLWLYKAIGMVTAICWYWVALAAFSCRALSWRAKDAQEVVS